MQSTCRLWFLALLSALFLQHLAGAQPPAAGNGEKEKPPERLIYLPFKSLKTVFEKPDGSVLIPYADYIQIWEKAFGDGLKKPERAPVGAVISSANYTVKVDKDVAQVSASFVIQVLEKGWAEIPIKFGEAAIGKMTSDSEKALLRGTGNGTYSLMLPSAGEHKIQLELTARVRTAPEGKSLDLDIPPVGITNFEFTVADADQTIELKPKLVTQPVDQAAKESKIKASLGSTEKVYVRWHPRIGTKPDMELLASVTNQTLVSVEDGLIHTDAWLTYEILRGQLDKVKLVVPKGHRILDITSDSKVKEWKAVEEDNRQLVSVEMLGRAEGKIVLEVHTEQAATVEAFDVAGQDGTTAFGIHAADVIRESGTISVRSASDLTLTVEEQRGLSRVDAAEVDAKLQRPGALYYRFYSPSFRLKLLTKPVEPRLIADHRSQIVYRDDQLRLKSELEFKIDRAGVFELKFKLPENLTIENVLCDRMKQFDVSSDKTTLTVGLREKTQGSVKLTVFATQAFDPSVEIAEQSLPLLEPLNVELEDGKIQIYAPDAIDVITNSEKLAGVQPDPAPQPEGVTNARLVSSWIYNHRPINISVHAVRKPTRVTASVSTEADVKQGQVQVTTRLNYEIQYAGLDTFRFAVLESLADKLQINSIGDGSTAAIKQKSRAAAAVDGWVTWTVVMQRDVIGIQGFEISYDLVPVVAAQNKSETAAIEAIRVLDPYDKVDGPQGKRDITVSRISGELTVIKDRALSVSAATSGGDVEPIDIRELRYTAQTGFVAFRYFKQPVKLELTASKFDIQGVVETVVSKALIEMVLDRTGASTNRCRFVLKTSERQRLRIDLPANIEPMGVLVDRKQVVLEKAGIQGDKNWDAYYINVARTKPSDEALQLTVVYRHTLNPPAFQTAGGSLAPRLPVIGGVGTIGTAVQQMHVKIWTPPEYTLVGTPKNFSVQTRTRLREALLGSGNPSFGVQDLDSWIGHDTGGIFDFPTEGKWFQYMSLGGARQLEVGWWHMPFYTWAISGAIVIIALILRNTSWDNKLTIVIISLFAACAYSLRDYDLVLNGLSAAIYGIVSLIAIWLIHSLLLLKPAQVGGSGPEGPTLKVEHDSSTTQS